MRGLVVAVCALGIAGAAAAGVITPPRADSSNPVWLDAHTIAFGYAQERWDHLPYRVRDDGTGFEPLPAPLPGRISSLSPDGAHRADVRNGDVYVDGRPIHAGDFFAWLSATRLAVGLAGYATAIDAVDLDGRHVRTLVTGYYSPFGFSVSPDGTQIAFTSYLGWGYDRGAAVYVAHGTAVTRVSPDVCTVRATLTTTRGTCFDGTDGADRITGTRYGDIVVAGDGDDVIHAGDGENTIQAQWGNDTILSGSGVDFVHAGSGDDTVRSGADEDWVNLGPGRDVVDAGRGADHIVANDGRRDVIDCGSGVDGVRADPIDVTRNCEHVTHAPPQSDQGY